MVTFTRYECCHFSQICNWNFSTVFVIDEKSSQIEILWNFYNISRHECFQRHNRFEIVSWNDKVVFEHLALLVLVTHKHDLYLPCQSLCQFFCIPILGFNFELFASGLNYPQFLHLHTFVSNQKINGICVTTDNVFENNLRGVDLGKMGDTEIGGDTVGLLVERGRKGVLFVILID